MSRDLGLLILRLAGLYLAIGHGWGKVVALAAGQTRFVETVANLGFPVPVAFAWAAALSEFAGGIAMALGLVTRWAAACAACTMFVAAFVRHRAASHLLSWLGVAPASQDAIKAWGNPELSTIFLIVSVAVVLLGPGRISLDARLGLK